MAAACHGLSWITGTAVLLVLTLLRPLRSFPLQWRALLHVCLQPLARLEAPAPTTPDIPVCWHPTGQDESTAASLSLSSPWPVPPSLLSPPPTASPSSPLLSCPQVGYTDLCAQLQPGEVMDLVHRLYSCFDDLIRKMRLFKVETVGDAYLAVGNLRWPQPENHAALMAQFALAAIRAATALAVHPDRPELGTVHVRVGLHCGPVVGSVVGTLNRRYCLFGDAVNTAARMEHNSLADRINCSGTFAALLREQWRGDGLELSSRGVMNVKGKG